MNDAATPRRSLTKLLFLALCVIAVINLAIYLMMDGSRNDDLGDKSATTSSALPSDVARGAVAAFIAHKAPRDMPEITFQDATGKQFTLADWRGRNVLLNIWATWCAPCREEMPALEKLQKAFGGKDFEVVTVSVDQKGIPVAKAFLEEIGVNLPLYADPTTRTLTTLKGVGLPTTVLINAEGKETGRLLGPAVWDSPDAFFLIEKALGRAPKPS